MLKRADAFFDLLDALTVAAPVSHLAYHTLNGRSEPDSEKVTFRTDPGFKSTLLGQGMDLFTGRRYRLI